MGAAKKQRTIEYFQRQGSIEIAELVKQDLAKLKEKQMESNKENKDEHKVTDIGR